MSTSPRGLAPLVLAMLLIVAVPGRAGVIRTGLFKKTVAAAPALQVVPHGLGTTPKAIILWTVGSLDASFASSYTLGFGATDGSTSRSTAAASLDGSGSSNAIRRMANKALTTVQWGGGILAESDLQSWDATNFTLNWTPNSASATVIHFIAIGGTDVSAKVIGWTTAGTAVNQSVTGIGFRPSVVLHSHVGAAFDLAPPANLADAAFGLGAMDAGGRDWTSTFFTRTGIGTSDTQRYQRPVRTISGITSSQTVAKEAGYVSMDPDGFTLKWVLNDSRNTQVFSLALAGIQAYAGSFIKSVAAAPVDQPITGIGFAPSAVFLTSVQDVARAGPSGHSRLGLGASDNAGAAGASACQDRDAANSTIVDGLDKVGQAYLKVDNDVQRLDAEATVGSFDSDGFTLRYGINDAVATEILYLALAPQSQRRTWTALCTDCPPRGMDPAQP